MELHVGISPEEIAQGFKIKEPNASAEQIQQWIDEGHKIKDEVTQKAGKMYEVNINADPAHFLDWDKPLSADMQAKIQGAAQSINPSLYERMMGTGRDLNKSGLTENIEGKTGESVVGQLKRGLGSNAAVSQALNQAGIPGIKYLDQGSRIRGNPTLIQSALDEARTNLAGAQSRGIPEQIAMHQKNVAMHEQMLKDSTQGSSNYVVFNDKLIAIVKKYGLAGLLTPGLFATNNPDTQ